MHSSKRKVAGDGMSIDVQSRTMASESNVSLKLRFTGNDAALGPGKIRLLELIEETGSIAGASRAMGMSYPRAWRLVEELNGSFSAPLVVKRMGGATRGGAAVTTLGHDVIRRYRSIEARIYTASAKHLSALEGALAK